MNNLYPDPETDYRCPTEEEFEELSNLEDVLYEEWREDD